MNNSDHLRFAKLIGCVEKQLTHQAMLDLLVAESDAICPDLKRYGKKSIWADYDLDLGKLMTLVRDGDFHWRDKYAAKAYLSLVERLFNLGIVSSHELERVKQLAWGN